MSKSFYTVLGVPESAGQDEIKKVYRKLAKQYHPDKNRGNVEAEAKFKEISEAYDILGDETKRAQYDQMRKAGFFDEMNQQRGSGGGRGAAGAGVHGFSFEDMGGFENIFENLFGGGRRGSGRSQGFDFGGSGGYGQVQGGSDITAVLNIPFELAAKGGNQTFSFLRPGDRSETRRLTVKIPPGVENGQTIKIRGEGEQAAGGNGDLLLQVSVAAHPFLKRDGHRISSEFEVDLERAVLGGVVQVPALDGPVQLKLPAGTQPGTVVRLKDKGLYHRHGRGDHFVTIKVKIPKGLTEEQKGKFMEFVEAL